MLWINGQTNDKAYLKYLKKNNLKKIVEYFDGMVRASVNNCRVVYWCKCVCVCGRGMWVRVCVLIIYMSANVSPLTRLPVFIFLNHSYLFEFTS